MRKIFFIFILLSIANIFNCERVFDNPSDSYSDYFLVRSKAFISLLTKGELYTHQSIKLYGGCTSQSVADSNLITTYGWDIDGDKIIDTTLINTDTLQISFSSPGQKIVTVMLKDELNKISEAYTILTIKEIKTDSVKYKADPDKSDSKKSKTMNIDCELYAMNKHTMAATLLFARTLTYNNKQQSISLGSFLYEFFKNLVGTVNIAVFTHPFTINFNNGTYTISNQQLSIQGVFHYGAAFPGHSENDTITSDLFNVNSYIADISFTFQPPYYSITEGPLWELIVDYSVDISNPFSPKVSFTTNFSKLKFSCLRVINDEYTMSAELNEEFTLDKSKFEAFFFNYEGIAYIPPFLLLNFNSMLNKDSLLMDFSGTTITTDTFCSVIQYEYSGSIDQDTFPISLTQVMTSQYVYFGNSGNKNKVHGDYSAKSKIFFSESEVIKSFFRGVYATYNLDTAQFYCDSAFTELIGRLYFDTPANDSLYFVSNRFNYDFTLPEGKYLFK